ncbi:hypothetical protein KAR91_02560 [Candidatus Pacearchaeota archaeon]|nr:hypothetical protein [Candidatus Pacearchaeota archaeon]
MTTRRVFIQSLALGAGAVSFPFALDVVDGKLEGEVVKQVAKDLAAPFPMKFRLVLYCNGFKMYKTEEFETIAFNLSNGSIRAGKEDGDIVSFRNKGIPFEFNELKIELDFMGEVMEFDLPFSDHIFVNSFSKTDFVFNSDNGIFLMEGA